MKVSFRQSGGIAGQVRGCDLDEKDLGDEAVRELRDLISQAGLSESFERLNPNARDAEVYDIQVESGDKAVKARFDEASMTSAHAQLVEFLQRCAGPLDIGKW